jgi:ketosteroid isomerase-like protein
MQRMEADRFRDWLERYAAAWRSNDAADVEALFAEDAVYSYGPFRDDEARGRDEIVRRWVEGGVQPALELAIEPLAVDGDRGVARWRVSFDANSGRAELDGILVCDFDAQGRCTRHLEWSEQRSLSV